MSINSLIYVFTHVLCPMSHVPLDQGNIAILPITHVPCPFRFREKSKRKREKFNRKHQIRTNFQSTSQFSREFLGFPAYNYTHMMRIPPTHDENSTHMMKIPPTWWEFHPITFRRRRGWPEGPSRAQSSYPRISKSSIKYTQFSIFNER